MSCCGVDGYNDYSILSSQIDNIPNQVHAAKMQVTMFTSYNTAKIHELYQPFNNAKIH